MKEPSQSPRRTRSSQRQDNRKRSQSSVFAKVCFVGLVAFLLSQYYDWLGRGSLRLQNQDTSLQQLRQPFPDQFAICSSSEQEQQFQGHHWLAAVSATTQWAFDQVLKLHQETPSSGRIHTLGDDDGPGDVECIIVESGKIVHAGTASAVQHWCDRVESSCDVRYVPRGYSVQPSFTDAHGHLLALGHSLLSVDLTGAASLQECVSRIEAFIEAQPLLRDDPDRWIEGNGWDQTRWNDTDGHSFPTSSDLSTSKLLRDRKISLKRIDFHALWLSPRAMDAVAAHGKLLPHPPKDATEEIAGGLVVRDAVTGRPTGVLIDNAMQLALDVIPPCTDDDRMRYLRLAQDLLFSHGITGVGDAAATLEDLSFYLRAQKERKLHLRVYTFLACPTGRPFCAEEVERHLASQLSSSGTSLPIMNEDASDKLSIRTVKLFADGALGSWGSAMWEPYADRPSERGLLLMKEEEVPVIVRYWHERGWQVATHAIGDRANSIVLDAYEAVLGDSSVDARPRIEHVQLLRTCDMPRFKQLGVLASMQPTHCTSDFYYVSDRIGSDRSANGAYAWSSLLSLGTSLLFSSDFPVESPSVLEGLWAATSRLDRQGKSPFGIGVPWYADERVTLAEAIRAFTVTPAAGQFQEQALGTLEAGKWADFILVKGDLFDARLRDAREVSVIGTAIQGEWVWTK